MESPGGTPCLEFGLEQVPEPFDLRVERAAVNGQELQSVGRALAQRFGGDTADELRGEGNCKDVGVLVPYFVGDAGPDQGECAARDQP
jgi:hypothetical protein